ncbi:MAG: hypothetical protein JNK65_06690 [Deltaproteobacteria bacterium]|nr:hypothetical protein [Deltaproteobacteria bacterium]
MASLKNPNAIEEEIGEIDHYYNHAHIAGAWIQKGSLHVGDQIHIKGHTTNFQERVLSLQMDHHNVQDAMPGMHVGFPVHEKVRPHDRIFVIHPLED